MLESEFTGLFSIDLIERPRRTFGEFLEQEIVIPSGPYEGRLFSFDFQPFTRHVVAGIDSGLYNRFAFKGPTQSGKTLICCVAPDCWCLFDLEETAVCGIPNMDMAADKWQQDFLPVIQASRYSSLLPTVGAGSRAGRKIVSVTFKNGVSLRFMGAGGKDKQRAGYTSSHLSMTEVNGYDESSDKSKEADKVKQMEGRVLAFRRKGNYRILMECTETDSEGRIHQEWENGTQSHMEPRCPHCEDYVFLDREHLKGWQDCGSEKEAKNTAYFECPRCRAHWSDHDRDKANRDSRLVNTKDALTFSFAWNGANNLFLSTGDLAAAEWKAKYEAQNTENAEKELCQFYWGRPYDPKVEDLEEMVNLDSVTTIETVLRRGIIPEWADLLTFGADVHAKLIYWVCAAWKMDGTGHVIDYGRIQNPYQNYGQEEAVRLGLVEVNALAKNNWQQIRSSRQWKITGGLVDARWLPDVVVSTIVPPLFPVQGFSASNAFRKFRRAYSKPRDVGGEVKAIGEGWHKVKRKTEQGTRYIGFAVDSDDAKSWVHRRFATPQDQPGCVTLFHTTEPDGHAEFFEHITAEKQVVKKGVVVWETKRKQNHWLDSMGYAAMAARAAGVRVVSAEPASPKISNAPAMPAKQKSRY